MYGKSLGDDEETRDILRTAYKSYYGDEIDPDILGKTIFEYLYYDEQPYWLRSYLRSILQLEA